MDQVERLANLTARACPSQGGADKKKPISRSARAGLQFPVGRIHRLLKVRVGAPRA